MKIVSDASSSQVLLELKEYATVEVDVDFVRKAVRAIGRVAIKLERVSSSESVRCIMRMRGTNFNTIYSIFQAAERAINVLLELIETKVNHVVQEAIIVIQGQLQS